MPYCPKCDMEFIDGITTCSDCGGPLVESKAVADAMKKKEKEEAEARQRAEYEAMAAAMQLDTDDDGENADVASDTGDDSDDSLASDTMSAFGEARRVEPRVYVKKADKYEDLKSSASAFYLVGTALVVLSVLMWMNVIKLPLAASSALITRSVLTIMGIAAELVGFFSTKSAREVSSQIAAEEQVTGQLIDWFTENYSGAQLDQQIATESDELSPEELSLKRFDLIQDIVVTNHDITDQAYVDALAEDIYSKLYEES